MSQVRSAYLPLLMAVSAAVGGGAAHYFLGARLPERQISGAAIVPHHGDSLAHSEVAAILGQLRDLLDDQGSLSDGDEPVGRHAATNVGGALDENSIEMLISIQEAVAGNTATLGDLHSRIESVYTGKEPPPTLTEIQRGKNGTDHQLLSAIYDEYRRNASEWINKWRLKTYDDVLGLLGTPTEIEDDGTWQFEGPPSGQPKTLFLRFRGGYVTTATIIGR